MITKAEFKTFIDINVTDYDSKIELIVAGVNAYVQKYCSNILIKEEVEEFFDGDEIEDDDCQIFLSNRANVADLVLSKNTGTESVPVWEVMPRDSYVPKLKEGLIKLDTVASGDKKYKAVYNAGYTLVAEGEEEADVPEDLKMGCLKLAGGYYNKSESEASSSEALDGASVSFAGSMNQEIKDLFSNYRIRTI